GTADDADCPGRWWPRDAAMTRDVLFEDLAFGESPRWHNGRLYLADVFAKCVVSVDLNGNSRVEAQMEDHPSGIGWLPDGTMLVARWWWRRATLLGSRRTPWLTTVNCPAKESSPSCLRDLITLTASVWTPRAESGWRTPNPSAVFGSSMAGRSPTWSTPRLGS